jgi:sigma-E factor negative regulatory protein RseC
MCRETALVKRIVEGGKVEVVIERAEACGSCAARGACQTLGGKTSDLILTVENRLGAEPGDQVVMTLSETSVVAASAVVYLLPTLCLIAGAIAGWKLASTLAFEKDPLSIIGAALGLVLGLWMAHLLGRRMGSNPRYIPKLEAIRKRVRTN